MLKYLKISAIAAVATIPVAAQASEQMARALKVAPGTYTISEMAQLMQVGGWERQQRVRLILRQREAFRRKVQETMHSETAAAFFGVIPATQ